MTALVPVEGNPFGEATAEAPQSPLVPVEGNPFDTVDHRAMQDRIGYGEMAVRVAKNMAASAKEGFGTEGVGFEAGSEAEHFWRQAGLLNDKDALVGPLFKGATVAGDAFMRAIKGATFAGAGGAGTVIWVAATSVKSEPTLIEPDGAFKLLTAVSMSVPRLWLTLTMAAWMVACCACSTATASSTEPARTTSAGYVAELKKLVERHISAEGYNNDLPQLRIEARELLQAFEYTPQGGFKGDSKLGIPPAEAICVPPGIPPPPKRLEATWFAVFSALPNTWSPKAANLSLVHDGLEIDGL